jgi:hypothetical protein
MAVILTGDMNDELDAATTQILNGPPRLRGRHDWVRPRRRMRR